MDLQALQRRLNVAGNDDAVRHYQAPYAAEFRPGGRVLDIGCGPGVFLEALRATGRHAVGVDASPDDVAEARRRGHEVIQADAIAHLETTDERYDGIFCAHLVEHLPAEAAVRLVQGAHRSLLPGGKLVVLTPDVRDLEVMTERFWLDLTHVRPYPAVLLAGICRESGFDVLRAGNDMRSGRFGSWKGHVHAFLRSLRLGEYTYRGDTVVIAARRG